MNKDYKNIKYANVLLRPLIADMLRDKRISYKDKMIHTLMFISAWLYRSFCLWEDPTNKKWEEAVRGKGLKE